MKKNVLITNLRTLAIILVVLGHSIVIFNPTWNYFIPKYKSYFFQYLGAIIYIFHLPLFFSISGFLYGISNKKNNYSFWDYFKSKAKRLLVPYILFSLFWLLPIRIFVGYINYSINSNSLIKIIVENIILGKDNGHLWFLPSLFIIFLIYYLLKKIKIISKNNILFLIFLSIISIFGGKFFPTYIGTSFTYLVWFAYGDFIRENIDYFKNRKKLLLIFSLLSIFLCILYLNIYLSLNHKLLIYIVKNIICIIWITILYSCNVKKSMKIVEKIDKNSFGIYLMHSPLIYITFKYLNNSYPIIIFIINFFFFGGISYLLTSIIRKIGLSFLIGENHK